MANKEGDIKKQPFSDTSKINIDTSPSKNENLKCEQNEIYVENSNNNKVFALNSHENAANISSASDFDEKESRNSINYTNDLTNFTENDQESNSYTSKNILDPLSEFDIQHNMENSISQSNSNDEKLVFYKLFPNVSLEKLEEDELFSLFSSHNGKNLTISDLYTNYLRLISALNDDFTKKSLVSLQNKLRSPGSLASSEKTSEIFFTKEQVLKMTPEQISQNYNIIRQSQQKW